VTGNFSTPKHVVFVQSKTALNPLCEHNLEIVGDFRTLWNFPAEKNCLDKTLSDTSSRPESYELGNVMHVHMLRW